MADVEAAAVAVVVQGAAALVVAVVLAAVPAAVHAVASVRVSSRAFFRVRRVPVAFSRGFSPWQRQHQPKLRFGLRQAGAFLACSRHYLQ